MPEMGNRMWVNLLMAGAAVAAVATAVVVWQRLQKHHPATDTRNQALGLLYQFQHAAATPLHVLRQIAEHMAIEMHAGLLTEGKSNLLMLPTYVDHLPDGDEQGLFYALDLGGTNFRVLRCLLGGKVGRVLKQEYEEVEIPTSLMLGTSEELFDFIAKRLVDFVGREGDEFKSLKRRQTVQEIGLTFSFPVKQTSVKSGILIQWSKGFKIADGVGADVVALLQSAIDRQHGPKIEVAVLVNDTVGTLAGGRYWNDDVMVGMILGTGTNACYVERDLPGHAHSSTGEMVINMEWGGFWSSHLPRTYADEQLDNESVNPGQAGYEKMIGGMYLGEIVRRVLLRMAREAALFGDEVPEKLRLPFLLKTPEMSKMHADESSDLRVVAKVLRDTFGVQKTELPARRIVHDVCDIVTNRSARLAAAGIVGILKKIGGDSWDASGPSGTLKTLHRNSRVTNTKRDEGPIVVAMDGGLYEHYTQYRIYMQAAVNELLSEAAAKRLVIQLSKDGSGIGASILAACHSQYRGSIEPYESTERAPKRPEKSVHFGEFRGPKHVPPNSLNSQFTQSEPKPTNSQFTQYNRPILSSSQSQHEGPHLRTSHSQSDGPYLRSSHSQYDSPNLCNSQSQSDITQFQPAAQHSVSVVYGLNIFE